MQQRNLISRLILSIYFILLHSIPFYCILFNFILFAFLSIFIVKELQNPDEETEVGVCVEFPAKELDIVSCEEDGAEVFER